MDYSFSHRVEATCTECQTKFDFLFWSVVDISSRPDLATRIRSGKYFRVHCPNGHQHEVDEPVLVYWDALAPHLLFVSAQETDRDGDEAVLKRLMSVQPIRSAIQTIGPSISVRRVARHMIPIEISEDSETRSLVPALSSLLSAEDGDSFFEVVRDHPELLSDRAEAALILLAEIEPCTEEGSAYSNFLRQISVVLKDIRMSFESDDLVLTDDEATASLGPLNSAEAAMKRFRASQDDTDLDDAICDLKSALSMELPSDIEIYVLSMLSTNLSIRFTRTRRIEDSNKAIDFGMQALDKIPIGNPMHALLSASLASNRMTRSMHLGEEPDLRDLDALKAVTQDTVESFLSNNSKSIEELLDCSASRSVEVLCPECDCRHVVTIWEIVDLDKRRDLQHGLRSGRHLLAACPNGHTNEVDEALLIHRVDETPALLFIPAQEKQDGEAASQLIQLLPPQILRASLVSGGIETGIVPRLLLPVVLADDKELQSLIPALLTLLYGADGKRWAELITEYPELLTDKAQEALSLVEAAIPNVPSGEDFAALVRERRRDLDELSVADLPTDDHNDLPKILSDAYSAWMRYEDSRALPDLDIAISCFERALASGLNAEHTTMALGQLGNALGDRHSRTSNRPDLDRAIAVIEQGLRVTTTEATLHANLLNSLSNRLSERFRLTKVKADLDESIRLLEEVVAEDPTERTPVYLANLSNRLGERFELTQERVDLDGAIRNAEASIELLPNDHNVKCALLANFGSYLYSRFQLTHSIADLNAAIEAAKEAISLTDEGDERRPQIAMRLSSRLLERFQLVGAATDIDVVITAIRSSLTFMTAGHELKPETLNNLSVMLTRRFSAFRELSDIEEAIESAREAISLAPESNSDRPAYLNSLGNALTARFRSLGLRADLDAAIAAVEEAVALLPENSEMRPAALNSLGSALHERSELTAAHSDIDKAIIAQEEAVELTDKSHHARSVRLGNLSNSLAKRFVMSGIQADLNAAIAASEEALALTPVGHRERPERLMNLGVQLGKRFRLTREEADLDKSISVTQEGISLTPDGHGDLAGHLNNLGIRLSERFELKGELADLDAAIAAGQSAVKLTADGDTMKAKRLNSLANRLSSRFDRCGAQADFDGAVQAYQAAIALLQVLILDSEDARQIAFDAADSTRSLLQLLKRGGAMRGLVEALERGKVLRLRAALTRVRHMPANLGEPERVRYAELIREIPQVEAQLRSYSRISPNERENSHNADVAKLSQLRSCLLQERAQLESAEFRI